MEGKKYYRELRNFEEFLETVPEAVKKNKIMMNNTKYLFKFLKRKNGKFFFITIFCPLCERYDTIHQAVLKMEENFKEKFEKDEPLRMMCQKCMDMSIFLFKSGVTDNNIVKSVLKEMAELKDVTVGD